MSTDLLHIAPWAVLSCAVSISLLWLLLRALRDRPFWSLAVLVVVPLLSALGFVVAISGFMFTPQLGWTLVTCVLIAVMLVPGTIRLGQQFARRVLEVETRRAEDRARDQVRRELVAWVSHDLRTPLAGIRAMAEALEDQVVSEPADVSEYGARISKETARLGSMVDDLFELSLINSGALRLVPEPLPLDVLARDAATGLAPLAAARQVGLRVHLDPLVGRGSGKEIERVMRNLLVNAVRHTRAGETVQVTGGEDDGSVWLSVTDGCGGIPASDLPKVFDVGFRGTAARSPEAEPLGAGAGLGLAIARGLMTAQSGQLDVHNVPGGCCFRLRLPAA
ncbi:MAG: two-component sensor histidine kinase [Phenylobacterium zucineum]|nr:MAG: two-component sensor histidine kinase [Phenylobacterium zucineum]